MMILELNRKEFYEDRTIGGLYIDGLFWYYTLEDKDRKLEVGGIKIPKETAIPRGRYQVVIDASGRFKRMMPHILSVPQFEGIRIHAGNAPVNTEGCPLIGLGYNPENHNILNSMLAFNSFFSKLETALRGGEVWIEVS